jgi:hypothetical protein
MSRIIPVPATSLTAYWDGQKSLLHLTAKGEVGVGGTDIFFNRIVWFGGLYFELLGSVPEVGPPLQVPYEKKQSFSIPNLPVTFPSLKAIIKTANYPTGIAIPIDLVWLTKPTQALDSKPEALDAAQAEGIAIPEPINGGTVNINALFKTPFVISETVGAFGATSIHQHHNDSNLFIQDASFEAGEIKWTFNSLQTGDTTIVVTYVSPYLGIPPVGIPIFPVVIRKVYNVKVFVLDTPAPAKDPIASTATLQQNISLDYLGFVYTGVRKVQDIEPKAELLKVSALPLFHIAIRPHEIDDFQDLTLLLSTPVGTASISSTGWGQWAPPTFTAGPYLGLQPIDATKIKVDIKPAAKALHDSGVTTPFKEIVLDYPLHEPEHYPKEPWYEFSLVDGTTKYVGADSGKVIDLWPGGLNSDTNGAAAPATTAETNGNGAGDVNGSAPSIADLKAAIAASNGTPAGPPAITASA